MNRFELQQLAEMRLSDAKALLETGANDAGAYYMAGYAVECALKAIIAKNQGEYPYPDFGDSTYRKENYFTHSIILLVKTARVENDLRQDRGLNPQFDDNWKAVEVWNETFRYQDRVPRLKTEELIEAVENQTNGVLSWLKQYW